MQGGDWQRRFAGVGGRPLSISVNLSARQLARPELAGRVARAIEDSGLARRTLTLEVTESVVLDDAAAQVLQQLRAVGAKVALDDFGTGYSSLSYLGRLPIDTLKIDRSFMKGVGAPGSREAVLARAVVSLAATLDMDTIAEGVETERQRQELLTMGSRLGQGFLFARPMTAERAEARLRTEHGELDPLTPSSPLRSAATRL
jgi:EAL domain-containing protein (putative c-di-GMP-specific phosphodiesterase class I)